MTNQLFSRHRVSAHSATAGACVAETFLFCSILILAALSAGCASSNMIPFTDSVRMSFTGNELAETNCYIASDMELISLRKGEVEGDDIFKREIKKTLRIGRDTPGRVIRSGGDWVQVQFADSINITFVRNTSTGVYQTPGWGTINVGEERFDINMRVLAGKNVDLLVGRTREP